jgi:hypothetical protein
LSTLNHRRQPVESLTPEVVDLSMAEMRAELARQVAAAGGICAWARKHGLSHAPVSLAKHGHRPVTEEIANACGFIVRTTFHKLETKHER